MMSRGLLFGRAEWPGVGSLLLSSTHLESFVGPEKNQEVVANRRSQARGAAAASRKRLQPIAPEAATLRARGCNLRARGLQPCAPETATLGISAPPPLCFQLRDAAALLEREARQHGCVGALLMGDTNWGDQDGDPLHELGGGWVDAWEAVGRPKAAKATCGWSWRLDRCFVLSLRPDAGGRALGAAGGGPSAGGGGGGGDGLAVRVAGVTLVGGKPIAGQTYEHENKRSGQIKCASNAKRAQAMISLSLSVCREGGRERRSARAWLPTSHPSQPAARVRAQENAATSLRPQGLARAARGGQRMGQRRRTVSRALRPKSFCVIEETDWTRPTRVPFASDIYTCPVVLKEGKGKESSLVL
jgi:hypothetical protein